MVDYHPLTYPDAVKPEDLGQLFTSFRYSAFRLETLDWYDADGEAEPLQAWLAGRSLPLGPAYTDWLATVRDAVAEGKTVQRVHVMTEPVSAYVHWELGWFQGHAVAAGEDIRLLPHHGIDWPRGLLKLDWWLFDDERVAIFRFDYEARLIDIELNASPNVAEHFRGERDIALGQAVPYADYLRANPWIAQPPNVD
jgi:hypothetical protein